MTDSVRPNPSLPDHFGADRVRSYRDRDDGLMADLLQGGGIFGDLSLERWLDRIESRGDRA